MKIPWFARSFKLFDSSILFKASDSAFLRHFGLTNYNGVVTALRHRHTFPRGIGVHPSAQGPKCKNHVEPPQVPALSFGVARTRTQSALPTSLWNRSQSQVAWFPIASEPNYRSRLCDGATSFDNEDAGPRIGSLNKRWLHWLSKRWSNSVSMTMHSRDSAQVPQFTSEVQIVFIATSLKFASPFSTNRLGGKLALCHGNISWQQQLAAIEAKRLWS